ncbi:hypothetical protein DFH28DRAFT_1077431 [Melampsora americana]|nr:hypothetical protein DFH28DRAFT_1077431 [Melampsora americana]
MMSLKFSLPFHLAILLILPFISSLPNEEVLLGAYKTFDQIKSGELETSLSKGLLKDSQKSTEIKILKNQKVTIEIPKTENPESLKGSFSKHNHRTKVVTPWKVYYDVAKKAFEASVFPLVKQLADNVLKLGSDANNIENGSLIDKQSIRDTIDLARSVLQNEALSEAERLWALAIVSHLNARISVSTPSVWMNEHLSNPREDLTLFLLKDYNLKTIIQKSWSSFPSKFKPSEWISETMQRESLINSIQKDLDTSSHQPSKEFSEIYLSFINLRSPVCLDRLSTFKKMVISYLHTPMIDTEAKKVFDEEKNVIKLLLYLEEHLYIGFRDFNALIQNKDICPRILGSDIEMQLSDNRLPSEFKLLLEKFQHSKELDGELIPEILRVLHFKPIPSQQLRRFLRVLDTLFASNELLFKTMDLHLNNDPKTIQSLLKILPKFLPSHKIENYSLWDRPKELKTLVLRKQEDQIAEKHRNDLADTLISNRVLSASETGKGLKVLTWNFAAPREIELTKILHEIFKVMSQRFAKGNFTFKDDLIEYIVHLISLKNDDHRPFWYLPVEDKVLKNANRINDIMESFFDDILDIVQLRNSRKHLKYLNR